MVRRSVHALVTVGVVLAMAVSAWAAGEVVTVQGRLTDGSDQPLNGAFDLTFRIYSAPAGGSPLWTESHSGVPVNQGLFSVNLGSSSTLPPSVFENSPRYLGISIGGGTELTPRLQLGATPYALRALSMPGFTPGPGNEVSGEFSFAAGDSNRIMNDYSSITGGEHNVIDVQNFADTLADTNLFPSRTVFFNSSSGSALHAIVSAFIGGGGFNHSHGVYSCVVGGWRDSAAAAFSTIGCGFANVTHGPASFAVVDGGFQNQTWGSYSSIGGGQLNQASGIGLTYIGETVGGGVQNRTLDHVATVGGGWRNFADGFGSTIGGGNGNVAFSNFSTVTGGQFNTTTALHAYVGGGQMNAASGAWAAIGGGQTNAASGTHATIDGGLTNAASGALSTMGGGANNTASGDTSVVGGGSFNGALGILSTIAGGGKNGAFGNLSTVGGGTSNSAAADLTVVDGGNSNTASGIAAAVGGGVGNNASADFTVVGGGSSNTASGIAAVVGGGMSNTAGPGANTVVPGGTNNLAFGDNSFAAGTFALCMDTCAFLWSDCCRNTAGTVSPLYSTGFNSWTARATGGFYMLTACDSVYDPTNPGTAGVYVPPGGSTWLSGSHSSLKENVEPVDGEEVLEKLDNLDINRWNYKAQDASVEHIGPMAEDFYATFGVGDNPYTISAVDPAGVALAAVKELHKKTKLLEQQSKRIDELEAKVEQLLRVIDSDKK